MPLFSQFHRMNTQMYCMNWTINNFVTCAMYVHLLYKSDSSYTIGGGGSVEVNNVLGAIGDDDNILVDDDDGDDE